MTEKNKRKNANKHMAANAKETETILNNADMPLIPNPWGDRPDDYSHILAFARQIRTSMRDTHSHICATCKVDRFLQPVVDASNRLMARMAFAFDALTDCLAQAENLVELVTASNALDTLMEVRSELYRIHERTIFMSSWVLGAGTPMQMRVQAILASDEEEAAVSAGVMAADAGEDVDWSSVIRTPEEMAKGVPPKAKKERKTTH